MNTTTIILSENQILQKIRRIAFEIVEQNYDEQEIILVGIVDNGFKLAELLLSELQKIQHLKCTIYSLELNKKTPLQSDIKLNFDIKTIEHKTVILIDDVLHTGRTLAYSLKPFLNIRIKKLQIAVLINRDYKTFPIDADYVGYALSTTFKEHITVSLENKIGVYLT